MLGEKPGADVLETSAELEPMSGRGFTADADAARGIEAAVASLGSQMLGRLVIAWRARAKTTHSSIVPGLWRAPAAQTAAEQRLSSLEAALRAGAFETAQRLLERLARTSIQDAAVAAKLRALELELLLAQGDTGKAAALTQRHRRELEATVKGSSLLALRGEEPSPWLPNGRPNLLALSRRIASKELSVEQLAGLLGGKRWPWLDTPELLLLFWSALWPTEPERALRFANHFLRLHRVPALELTRAEPRENVLAQLGWRRRESRRNGPLVSVIVAARNAEGSLRYAIESLLAQTHTSLELLIGDDASQDGTLELMRCYAGDRRVRLFRSVRNQGAYNLRNALAARARGELVTFHDADDLALSTRLERQVDCLRKTRAVACATDLLRLRPDGGVIFFKDQKASRLSRVSLMLERRLFERIGPFRSARFGADEELHARITARFGPRAIARIKAPLMLSLWAGSSATRMGGSESLEDGYRSPSRRLYSELVYLRYVAERDISEESFEAALRESNNSAAPQQILELQIDR